MTDCKCCGKKMKVFRSGLAGIATKPMCKCGKIRLRERKKGCYECGSPGKWDILIRKHWYGWLLYCACGHKWRVWK